MMEKLPSEWEEINLNNLPTYSEWPDRIFGVSDWSVPDRDIDKVIKEYDEEKYKNLLEHRNDNKVTEPKKIKKKQLLSRSWQFSPIEQNKPHTVVSQNEELYFAPVLEAQWYNDKMLSSVFKSILNGDEIVMELGAGYGYNLHSLSQTFTDCEFVGGELSENAVRLSNKLYRNVDNVRVSQFNYYDENYELLETELKNDVVLFTRLSIEQLPECRSVIEQFINYKNKIDTIVHLEPVYDMYNEDTLLGLLRKKYTEINDYNRDLFSSLEQHKEVEIQKTEHDIFGDNGLCPMSLIQWEPK